MAKGGVSVTLIQNIMDKCHLIDIVTSDDAYGSARKSYRVGASIDAAIIKNSTTEAIVAEKQGITEIFTVVTNSGSMLDYHSIIRRDSDKEYFIITSREVDSKAPAQSTVQISKVNAERWKVPNGVIIDEGNSGEA